MSTQKAGPARRNSRSSSVTSDSKPLARSPSNSKIMLASANKTGQTSKAAPKKSDSNEKLSVTSEADEKQKDTVKQSEATEQSETQAKNEDDKKPADKDSDTSEEEDTSPRRDRKKWALLFKEGKGDLWSSSFRLACRDKTGPAWERDGAKPSVELSDMVLNALMENFDSQKIDRREFMEALFSPLLKLHLSDEEKNVLALMYDVNKDKKVERDEVGSLCRELLGIYCMKTCLQPKKTWCRIELPHGEYISVNKRYYRLSSEHPIEKDQGEGGHPSGLEIKFKETFDYALAEVLESLKLTRRQEPITKEFIYQAASKFHLLTSKTKAVLDKKVFGGQTFPTFKMDEAVKKLKECLYAVNTIRFPHEIWSPLTSEHRGIFWLNNTSMEAYASLPPIYVRLLQYQIKDRDERLKVIPGLRKREEQANALEIETAEQKEKIEKLTEEVAFLQSKQEKSERDLDTLQRDLMSRSEELSGKTIDIMHYKKQVASLEKRIDEYEKIYSQYELNKELLKFSQRTVKEKEDEMRKRVEENEELRGTIRDYENQVKQLIIDKEKLVQDIREEVKLNEEKEIQLEVIPEYERKATEAESRTKLALKRVEEKDEVIKALELRIADLQREIEDCESELRVLPEITQDTKYLSCQVWTLRRLLSGKDEIIRKQLNQVAQITGNVEDVYGSLPAAAKTPTDKNKLTLSLSPQGTNRRGSPHLGGQLQRQKSGLSTSPRPPSRRTQKMSSVTTPMIEWKPTNNKETIEPIEGGKKTRHGNWYSDSLDLNSEPVPDYHDTDLHMSKFITKGFRLALREMKREKYGKVPLVGTVKWMGTLDRRKSHHRLYIGLKLDSKAGNTDGIVHGKRLFKCEPGFGKVVLAEDIESVFDRKEGRFLPVVMYLRIKEMEASTSASSHWGGNSQSNTHAVITSGDSLDGNGKSLEE